MCLYLKEHLVRGAESETLPPRGFLQTCIISKLHPRVFEKFMIGGCGRAAKFFSSAVSTVFCKDYWAFFGFEVSRSQLINIHEKIATREKSPDNRGSTVTVFLVSYEVHFGERLGKSITFHPEIKLRGKRVSRLSWQCKRSLQWGTEKNMFC